MKTSPTGVTWLDLTFCLCVSSFELPSLYLIILTAHFWRFTDVDQGSMIKLMSHAYMLKVLCINETSLVDDALFGFQGCSLEELDVSETKV